ncbi:MAG: DUF4384 domain-containing protein [Polyangia bacterium]
MMESRDRSLPPRPAARGLSRRCLLAGGLLLVLTGCPSTGQRRGEGGGALFFAQVQALSGGFPQPLRTGQPVAAGERFGLLVESREPRYLQLALLAPDDPTPTLWPQEDVAPPRLQPGRPVNIPGSTHWFRAEPRAGQGALVLVLSPEPLSPSELSAKVHEPPLAPLPAHALGAAAGRDPAAWSAWSLPPGPAVLRLSLPQR